MHISALAVRRPVATCMLLLAVVMLGLVALPRLELTLLPEITADHVAVWIPYPDAGVEELEESVVLPLEEALVTVPGVKGLRSRIVSGGATLTVHLHPGSDPDVASLAIRERLDAARWSLPEGVERPIILGAAEEDADDLVLALGGVDLAVASEWAESVLRPRLEQIDGVARVEVVGAPRREIRVVPDPRLLEATGVGITEIAAALASANVNASGGYLRRREIRYALNVESALADAGEVADVVVARRGERTLRVSDLAEVIDGFEDPRGWSRLDGQPAVGLLVTRESGANLIKMSGRVHERLDEIAGDFPEFKVAVISDPSPFVRQSIGGVWRAVWLGGLLAYAVLMVFLRDRRSPLFLIASLPLSVIPTFALLDLLGVSLNLMSLGGIALGVGMLVDNAIICLENIHRLRVAGLPAARAAAQGAREVALPMLASTLTTCAVFVPLAWVPGSVGELFRDQAVAVSVSLLVSLIIALTLLPMLAGRMAPFAPGPARMPLYDHYHRLLTAALRRPGLTLGITALALGTSLTVLARMPREMFPEMATENLEVALRLPSGTDVTATDLAVAEIETWLLQRSEIDRVFAAVGSAGSLDPADRDRESNRASVRARLRADAVGQRSRLVNDLLSRYDARGWELEVIPDRPEFAALPGADLPTLTCEIAGRDPIEAEELARRILEHAADDLQANGYPLRLSATETEPRYRLSPREDAIQRHGLRERNLRDAISASTSGLEATRLRRFDQEDPVVIRTADWTEPAAGRLVTASRVFPVRELFEVHTELAPARLLRENQARVVAIHWDGPLRRVEPVKAALEAATLSASLPPGYSVRFGGAYVEMRRTLRGVLEALALSAGLVLLILAAQFESIRLPLIIFAAVPLSVVGVTLALIISRGSVNVISGIGAIVLVGIVVNDAILKVDLIRRLRAEGTSLREAIFTASHRRYRPILMTTATTSLALLPLFFGRGAEFRAPLAATAIGGLLSATVLTLVIIPVLFQLLAGRGVDGPAPVTAIPGDGDPR